MLKAFCTLKIFILLGLFCIIVYYVQIQKALSRSWSEPLEVIIYPINGDEDPDVETFIKQLTPKMFFDIDHFFQRQASNYQLKIKQPFQFKLGSAIQSHPPMLPSARTDFLSKVWWAIRFRLWAALHTPPTSSNALQVRIYIHYHKFSPDQKLQHSLGVDKGRFALIHGFAATEYTHFNNVIIAHELLHTVGATDKYDLNSQPVFPQGYADPNQYPLYPQTKAEIMAAKIAISENHAILVDHLNQCLIGSSTAQEINWLTETKTPG
jgi:hypothetical protein